MSPLNGSVSLAVPVICYWVVVKKWSRNRRKSDQINNSRAHSHYWSLSYPQILDFGFWSIKYFSRRNSKVLKIRGMTTFCKWLHETMFSFLCPAEGATAPSTSIKSSFRLTHAMLVLQLICLRLQFVTTVWSLSSHCYNPPVTVGPIACHHCITCTFERCPRLYRAAVRALLVKRSISLTYIFWDPSFVYWCTLSD